MRLTSDPKAVRLLASRIRNKRHDLKISQKLAANLAGCHINHYSRIERAECDPSLTMLIKIANALNIELAELLNF